jgi:outer membrane protein assembly factor BamB
MKSSPVVLGATTYVVSGRRVLAVNAGSGTVIWRSEEGFVGSPASDAHYLFVLGINGSMHALDIADGREVWTVDGSFHENASPLAIDGLVISGGNDGKLRALDSTTGDERWSATFGGPVTRSAAAEGDVLFVGSDDGVFHALSATTGTERWSKTTSGTHFATPAVRDGIVYVSTGSSSPHELLALDAATGQMLWTFPAPADSSSGMRSPSVDGGSVYISGIDAGLYAISRSHGSKTWTWNGAVVTEATIAIVGDSLFLFGADGNAYVLDGTTGVERSHVPVGGVVAAGTTVAGGRLYAASDEGHFLAIVGSAP